jgi:hypothetical protein
LSSIVQVSDNLFERFTIQFRLISNFRLSTFAIFKEETEEQLEEEDDDEEEERKQEEEEERKKTRRRRTTTTATTTSTTIKITSILKKIDVLF